MSHSGAFILVTQHIPLQAGVDDLLPWGLTCKLVAQERAALHQETQDGGEVGLATWGRAS